MKDRYEIRNGRFGAYHYDKERKTELTLIGVQERLNYPSIPISKLEELVEYLARIEGAPSNCVMLKASDIQKLIDEAKQWNQSYQLSAAV